MTKRTSLIAAAAAACALAAGCGDDSGTPQAAERPADVDLEQLLMRDGEIPGFDPIEQPRTVTLAGVGGDFSEEERALMRRVGLIKFVFQPIVADNGNAGVTNVNLYKSADGAREWFDYETSDEGIHNQIPDTKIRRFSVDGVPGARGWTGTDLHGNRIGHVFWLEGRCMFVLGNEGRGGFVKPLSAGATAMHARTKGNCAA